MRTGIKNGYALTCIFIVFYRAKIVKANMIVKVTIVKEKVGLELEGSPSMPGQRPSPTSARKPISLQSILRILSMILSNALKTEVYPSSTG
mmetsp:Transcript_10759/g.15176  ORF Transcript_10759/g.15176 Transcript_10759/m.15176 type:complete len:91 (+) Transcript_10759:307-579(+)